MGAKLGDWAWKILIRELGMAVIGPQQKLIVFLLAVKLLCYGISPSGKERCFLALCPTAVP